MLIPIYREADIYRLFYDQKANRLYKFSYRKKSSVLYMGLFLILLYGSNALNNLYQQAEIPLTNILLCLIALAACFGIAKYMDHQTYEQSSKSGLYFDNDTLKRYAIEGLRQFEIELYVGMSLSVLIMTVGFSLFLIVNHLVLLVIGCLGLVRVWMFLLTKPLRRYQLLQQFKEKEIYL
ncbi:hypothetical protein [Gracilibacillus salinarum]|uniref:ABC transporter permease n=1 Tax=Gracilibacillus salinarum TaxID=2932255 RepID=A0ABY4GSZ4_9BACI|nr:hypothetical protein [Gracilibacillus salinarum]UOQ86792.1 hypothetical protein MUN87_07870 [Gracilibacillus salinarum]